ncbi:MAG: hypothetical protein U0Q16_39825 [Bryobacteraceae bacterium]
MPNRYGWMSDTSPDAFEKLMELIRTMTPGEKLRQAFRLTRFMIRMQEAAIRREHPEAPGPEIHLRAASRRLGRELMISAYGWDPAEHDA